MAASIWLLRPKVTYAKIARISQRVVRELRIPRARSARQPAMRIEPIKLMMKFSDSLAEPGNVGHGILAAVMRPPLIMTPRK
jgi:hypothetical protein